MRQGKTEQNSEEREKSLDRTPMQRDSHHVPLNASDINYRIELYALHQIWK
jgi:hypothetical protein